MTKKKKKIALLANISMSLKCIKYKPDWNTPLSVVPQKPNYYLEFNFLQGQVATAAYEVLIAVFHCCSKSYKNISKNLLLYSCKLFNGMYQALNLCSHSLF